MSEENVKGMYRVAAELYWESLENNSGPEIVAYCKGMSDAEAIFNSRCSIALREKVLFERVGGYYTKSIHVYSSSYETILQRFF
jgi:hypothetical protein